MNDVIDGSTSTIPRRVAVGHSPRVRETVLVVDDENTQRALMGRVLRKQGYVVTEAPNGAIALDIAAHMPRLDVLVTDMVMPHLDGSALALRLAQLHPKVKTVLVSGYSASATGPAACGSHSVFLTKPFRLDRLVGIVGELVKESGSTS